LHNGTECKVLSRRGIFHNVTERKQAEADRARLLAILEEAPDFIGTFTADGKVLWLNRALRKLRNLGEKSDLSQQKIGDFHPAWANHLLAEALPTVYLEGRKRRAQRRRARSPGIPHRGCAP
jgi:PAS domain-containing protein